jgi:hypothetical protein
LRTQSNQLNAGMLEHRVSGTVDEPCGASESAGARTLEPAHAALRTVFGDFTNAAGLAEIVLDHLCKERLMAAEAELYQARASACLGRAAAFAPLSAATLFLGHRLRHPAARLPYVMDALRDELGLRVAVTSRALTVLGE